MSISRYFYLLFFAMLGLSACSEFIESSIAEEKVILLAPADSLATSSYNQRFWWEGVEDALQYRLQIVEGSFDSVRRLEVDTVVRAEQFTYTLPPGRFEWRVRGENGSSETLYTKRVLVVHESSIANQQIEVKGPANSIITNQSPITFQWNELFGSTQYRLQIDTNNFANESAVFFDKVLTNTSLAVELERSRQYHWRVRGENDSVETRWSTLRVLTFDNLPPAKVTVVSPANKGTSTKPVSFQWNAVPEAKKYEFLLFKSDSTTLYNSSFPAISSNTNFVFTGGELNEVLFWKVRAGDEAGNWGEYSQLRSVTIQ